MRSARARTDEEKAALLERLLDSWKAQPRFRLGQLLVDALRDETRLWSVGDYDLIRRIEAKVQIGAGRYFPGWEGPEQG